MRAAWYEKKGPAKEVIQFGEMPIPEAGPEDVCVKVSVSGINPADTQARGGGSDMTMPFPRIIPHQDGAGLVERVGKNVSAYRVGERVWVYQATWQRPFGTAAEYVVVPSRNAVPLPDGVDFTQGACLGIPALTAHRCLFADGPIQGQTVLVAGGGGAVGQSAVQLAKWAGARVITTVRTPEQAAAAHKAGADFVVNHQEEDVAARVREITAAQKGGIDRVVEVAFSTNVGLDIPLLNTNGVLSTYASGKPDAEARIASYAALWGSITIHFVSVYQTPKPAHQAAIHDITACLEAGALRYVVAARFPLGDVAAAQNAQDSGRAVGKIVVDLN